MAVATEGKNPIMIYGPWHLCCRIHDSVGDVLAISIPRTETAVIRPFQERMPYGLFVPEKPMLRLTVPHKGCDIIVMASHGRSGLSAILLEA
jgi:hypothetical protein